MTAEQTDAPKRRNRQPRKAFPEPLSDGTAHPPKDPDVSIIVASVDAFPMDRLAEYHKNPNKGQVSVIDESLATNGLYRSIVVNIGSLTGRPFEVLGGNHTFRVNAKRGATHMPVDLVDVDEQRAAKIVVVDNEAAAKAKRDTDTLAELLGTLDDLEGTALTDADLAKMLGDVGEGQDESNLLDGITYSVMVTCTDEDHQVETLDALQAQGYEVKAMMT